MQELKTVGARERERERQTDRQTELMTRYVGMDAELDMASNIVSAAARGDTE